MPFKIDKYQIQEKAKYKCEEYKNYVNKKRRDIKYEIGDKILIKNNTQNKIESKWKGPYEIKSISTSGNNLFVEMDNKIVRVSIKNCRNIGRGENVVLRSGTTSNWFVNSNIGIEFDNFNPSVKNYNKKN
ncbi:Retrovirus-related Pol polyprotein from transposon [Dictyocoela muelleri]|nr:Retrovirus-related Pol polyprotein from transposon [Dictyocoela muelleri]